MQQGGIEWHQARTGRVTASNFHLFMSDGRRKRKYKVSAKGKSGYSIIDTEHDKMEESAGYFKLKKEAEAHARNLEPTSWPSQSALSYIDEIVSEIDSNVHVEKGESKAMRWGNEWEEEARQRAFEIIRKRFGRHDFIRAEGENAFFPHPKYPMFGASPDFLIGEDAGGELKCPHNGGRHVTACCDTKAWFSREYKWQIQGNLWCTGRKVWYAASYNPRSRARPIALTPFERDEEAIELLEEKALAFWEMCQARLDEFRGQPF